MTEEDPYSGLDWMSEKTKAAMRHRDQLVHEENIEGIFALKSNSDFSIGLHQVLINRYDKDPKSLPPVHLNLFLSMHLENAGQASTIVTFLQEWFPGFHLETVKGLKEIGAVRSAAIIEQAIALLPEDGSWFFKTATTATQEKMDQFDSQFSDYPDGPMDALIRKYAEKHRQEF